MAHGAPWIWNSSTLGLEGHLSDLPFQAQGAAVPGTGCCYFKPSVELLFQVPNLRNFEVFGGFRTFLEIFINFGRFWYSIIVQHFFTNLYIPKLPRRSSQ